MNCLRKGKPMKNSPYWIKHRFSAQSNYYVAEGQKLVSYINRMEKKGCLYGHSTYHRFDSKDAYLKEIESLKASGAKFI